MDDSERPSLPDLRFARTASGITLFHPVLPVTHPLIEAATKPLADNAEQRLAANALLEETTEPDHPASKQVISRWEKTDVGKRPYLRVSLLYGFSLVSLVFFLWIATTMVKEFRLLRSITISGPVVDNGPYDGFSPSETLLLGDPSLTRLERKQTLLASDPKNPAFYAEFAGEWREAHSLLPDDYLETVSRIAPENSFFLYIAAATNGGDSVSKIKNPAIAPNPPRDRDGQKLQPLPRELEWAVSDQHAFDEAIATIRTASQLPLFDSYETRLSEMRIPLFPQDKLVGRLRALAYSGSQSTQVIPLRKIADLLSARAYLQSVAGDKDGFLETHAISEAFLKQLGASPVSPLVNELVFTVIADSTSRALHHGAMRLGIPDLTATLGERVSAFQEERDRKQLRTGNDDGGVSREGSALAALIMPMVRRQVADPPPLERNTLTPGRRADHDFISASAMSLIVSLLVIGSLSVLLFRLRAPRHVRVVAGRFVRLLDARDWVWIFGIGLAIPFAFAFVTSWLTPFGGRDLGIRPMAFLFPALHFKILLTLLLLLPPLAIRWRISKKAAPFGLDFMPSRISLLIPALAIPAAVLPFCIMGWRMFPQSLLSVVAAALVVMDLAVMSGVFLAIFGKPGKRLRRAAVAHALLPVYALAVIISIVTIPPILASAQKWISKDELSKVAPTGFSYYEAEVAAQRRRETNAILGFEQ